MYIYNLLKRDKPNHRRGRDKGHITRAKRMSETEPKGEKRVYAKVGAEEKTWGETCRGSRGADSETE